jgi:starch phosphorylase
MLSSTGVIREQTIAYFSMECGILSQIPTYAGGLGILAGDIIRSSADLRIPLVGVTLASRHGYFRQEIDDDGWQHEQPVLWDPGHLMEEVGPRIEVRIDGRDVAVRAWQYVYHSITGGRVPLLFLDTDIADNKVEDRKITNNLYDNDRCVRFAQECILGIGGVRMLDALGYPIRKYHMNEGHSALLGLELLHRHNMDEGEVRGRCVFTTHTPIAAGQDRFAYDLVDTQMEDRVDRSLLRRYGGRDELNMTLLGLNLSAYVNGVAKRHRDISSKMFRGYTIHAITNGVHSFTWTAPSFRQLYDRYLPGWANEPELLVRQQIIPNEYIWHAHEMAKHSLVEYTNRLTGSHLCDETLTLGFARRFAPYKRPTFVFSDLERLRKVGGCGKIQIVMAGKAYPSDREGKRLIAEVLRLRQELSGEIEIAFIPDYDMDIAARIVAGVDVWLNTPERPMEASGTSGMKAAHNGVPNFSVLDGWWIEGCIEDVTGWSIGPPPDVEVSPDQELAWEIDDLYNKLGYVIRPLFYRRRDEWIEVMNNAIGTVAYYFNTHRMMRRYVTEAYL